VSEGRPGLELRQPPRIQQLPAGGYLNVVLPEPGRYTVVAVCDGECDVDLWAFGSNGRSVGREAWRWRSPPDGRCACAPTWWSAPRRPVTRRSAFSPRSEFVVDTCRPLEM
jgi:hypothetical protein